MGKGVKAFLAVIAAHSAGTHAAKAHMGGSQMDNRIIDAAAAKLYIGRKLPDPLLILREIVSCQGMGPAVDQRSEERRVGKECL